MSGRADNFHKLTDPAVNKLFASLSEMNNYVSFSKLQLSVVNQSDNKEISISTAYDDVTLHYGTQPEHPGISFLVIV